MAEILEWAGKRDALSLPYSGTLLVPNNAVSAGHGSCSMLL